MDHETLISYLESRRRPVEAMLLEVVGEAVSWPAHLHRAMRYSLFPGGKRLRPLLAVAAYEAVAPVPDLAAVLPLAVAIELLHTYSLIHDDLPAMDDSDIRRGRPTNHRVHGDALAILAGDGLQVLAFQLLTDRTRYPAWVEPGCLLDVAHEVCLAMGEEGLVGGQSMDLGYEGEVKTPEQLAFVYGKKTGGLLSVCVTGGARLGGGTQAELKALATFGDRLGLAFQLTDDLLDDLSVSDVPKGRPGSLPSVVSLMGERGTREWCAKVIQEALDAIAGLDERADPLRAVARWVPTRKE